MGADLRARRRHKPPPGRERRWEPALAGLLVREGLAPPRRDWREGGKGPQSALFFFFFLQAGTLVEQVQVLRDERVQVFLLNAKYFFPHILCDEFAHTLVRFSQPEFRLNLFKNVNE